MRRIKINTKLIQFEIEENLLREFEEIVGKEYVGEDLIHYIKARIFKFNRDNKFLPDLAFQAFQNSLNMKVKPFMPSFNTIALGVVVELY